MIPVNGDIGRVDERGPVPDGGPGDDRALRHDVYAVIVEWIHQGALRPGDRVSEAAIARELGISRGPVREAMSRLDHEGLVVRRPRRGAVVAQLTAKDLGDIAAVRQLIEGHAARCACQRLTPTDATELERLIAAMRATARAGRWTETASLNARFHQTVVRIADNTLLSKVWQTLHPLAWLLAPAVSPHTPHDIDSLVARHQALLAALQAGDPDRAEAAFREHVLRAARLTRQSVAEPPRQPLPRGIAFRSSQAIQAGRSASPAAAS
ncbi:MAG: GntR family transcriptional regulator [Chloroflexota bacterium]|nr:GntR family transcriptional regulator [Chloroflexota bacterium]